MSALNKKKVVVGLSGGVDSSVAAFLLREAGYRVEGVFMKNWQEDDRPGYCAAYQDAKDAEKVAEQLKIPFHTVNFSEEYWDQVFDSFLKEYHAGRTPNPDVLCNTEIKFKAFLNYARLTLGADYLATGHYARCTVHADHVALLKALDINKDQTYFLSQLNQNQLKYVLFPIGELRKPEVRQIARKQHLTTQNKAESMGICFIGERKFKNFLQEYLPAKPGSIETPNGEVLGRHDGLMYYTLGQRQGLGIGGIKQTTGSAWYVADKDLKRNVLIVVQGNNHPFLFKQKLLCGNLHWIYLPPRLPCSIYAKIRYRQKEALCTLEKYEEAVYQVTFVEPQRAITPGQAIAFYQEEICLGGGSILTSL